MSKGYDFIVEVNKKQQLKGFTDSFISKETGIPEYIYYDLKKYRTYLTRVAYYSLCVVLDLDIEDSETIDYIIELNKTIVGSPDTNLKLAAQSVNPEYVDKLEKEVKSLQILRDRLITTYDLVKALKDEIKELEKKNKDSVLLNKEEQKKKQQDIARELGLKMSKSLRTGLEKSYDDKINELTELLKKKDIEIKKCYELYYIMYMEVLKGKEIDIDEYPLPHNMKKEDHLLLYEKGHKLVKPK